MDSQQKRILYVITKSVWGGAQRYVFDMATNAPHENFKTAVAVGGNGLLTKRLMEKNVPTYHVAGFQKSINPFKDIATFFELLLIYNKFQPDIIHTNSSKAGGIASAAALLYKAYSHKHVSCIFTVHGWAFLEPWRPAWQRFLIRYFSKLTIMLHDHVIVISKYDRKAAFSYNIASPSKVTLVHNGIEDLQFQPREISQQELFGEPYSLVIGTIAEWTNNKGLTYLIEAMPAILKKFPNVKLCLIGWGEENEKLKAKSEKLGIGKNNYFLSRAPAAQYIKAFDVFVLPSLKEGLPYTLLEAGLARLPVVATRVGGVPEIIEHEKTGLLVEPASPAQLAEAIISLLSNEELREDMGKRNKERVLSLFSLSEMIEKTIKLYDDAQ